MINLRSAVYQVLVDEMGVSKHMLSNVNSGKPIKIELENGDEIIIDVIDDSIFIFSMLNYNNLMLPVNVKLQTYKLFEIDPNVYFSFAENKISMIYENTVTEVTVTTVLKEKFQLIEQIRNSLKRK